MFTATTQGRIVGVTALVVLLGMSLLVVRMSSAAFTASTTNPGNAWQTGQLALTNDRVSDVPQAMFSTADAALVPGQSVTECITVTYTGDVGASVKLYSSGVTFGGSPDTSLSDDLVLLVEQGTIPSGGSCETLAGATTITSGSPTLSQFATGTASFEDGLGTWTPAAGSNAALTYRITVTLRGDSTKQGHSLTGYGFQWEARNT